MTKHTAGPETANAVEATITHRRSVRHFSDRPIEPETLKRLVNAGIYAPSGSNWQNQRFLIIDDKAEIARVGETRFVWPYQKADLNRIKKNHPAGIIGKSAALILVFSDSLENDRRNNGEYYIWQALEIQNCSASIQNILLMAASLGIGTCWISASETMNYSRMLSGDTWRKVLATYDIPAHYKIQGVIMLGYPTSTDELEFPVGEKMHGATIWQGTERKPLEHYLIRHGRENSDKVPTLPKLQQIKLRLASQAAVKLMKVMTWLNQHIYKIEIKRVLADMQKQAKTPEQ